MILTVLALGPSLRRSHAKDISSLMKMTWFEKVWGRLDTLTGPRKADQVELEALFGVTALESLRSHVERGDIGDESLEKMAQHMGVIEIYSQHHKKLDNVKVLEVMLGKWFRQILQNLQPREARMSLMFILKVSDCPSHVLEEIESALFEQQKFQHFRELWKYLQMLLGRLFLY